jgi:superfamily I DNA/RNA helicase
MKTPKLKPSLQQAGFYDWVINGKGSCILEAVAGAGKTTTLIEALKLMTGKIFFGAYNKKIAEEIAGRAGMRNGLEVSTMHAAGMRAWRRVADKFCKVDGDKCRSIFRDMTFRQMDYGVLESPVIQLVSYAKQAAVGVISDQNDRSVWMQLITHFNVECFDEYRGIDNTDTIIMLAKDLFMESANACRKVIDFDDMIFAPLFFNVTFDKYDWVLIDEAQDTNASRREMALRMMKDTSRLVAVGDRHQAIYGFTGADADALDKIGDAVNATRMPLTTTFRCPKAVVLYSQQWVNHIQAAETAPEGVVRTVEIAELQNEVKVGDAILCRFNAPLIKYVYQLIAAGIPARVEGREIGAGLKQLANRWKVKSIDALITKLDDFLEREVKKFTEKEQPKRAQDVADKVECLRVIIDRVIAKGTITQPPQTAVIAEIDAIFGTNDKDNLKPVVLLSSIHKSKGREWKKVVWLQTGPSGFAKQEWEVVQENNLCYVASTRAMHELVLIEIMKK